MKKILLAAISIFIVQISFAQPGLKDDFTSGVSGDNLNTIWTKTGTGPATTIQNSSQLTFSTGNYASAGGNGNAGGNYIQNATPNSTASNYITNLSAQVSGSSNPTFYYSFLLNITSIGGTTGSYFAYIGDGTTATPGTNFIGRLFAKDNGSSAFNIGISKASTTGIFGSTAFTYGTTYLIIVRYSFIAGSTNDQIAVWVNPVLTSEPSLISAEVSSTANSDGATGSGGGYGVFGFRPSGSTQTPIFKADGVKAVSSTTSSATAWQNLMANANYYLASSGNANSTASWGSATDGTGLTPPVFTDNYHIFNLRNNATPTIGADWTISGTESKAIVGNGTNACNFTIPSSFSYTGTVDVNNAGTLTIQNTTIPTFGTLASGSTVNYNGSGSSQTITGVNYSNLTLNNTSNATLGGASTVTGTLTLTNGTFTNGANLSMASASTISRANGTLGTVPTFTGSNVNVTYTGSTSDITTAMKCLLLVQHLKH